MLEGSMQRRGKLTRRVALRWLALLTGSGLVSLAMASCRDSEMQEALSLEIACNGNNLAFDKTTLTIPAGQLVRLTFSNISTTFQHNWVLVAGGEEVAERVNQAATAAGPRLNYVPTDKSLILAYTKLITPGVSDTISFTAPEEAGQYSYLCTFPGHYLAGMKGVLAVTA